MFLEGKQAWRSLRRDPVVVVTVVAVLALGIGVNTALFSIVDRVLLRPFPYPALDRMAVVAGLDRRSEPAGVRQAGYDHILQNARTIERMAHWRWRDYLLTGVQSPEALHGMQVSPDLFPILGAHPLLGRTFAPDEFKSGAPAVAIIGYRTWQRHFHGEPGIVGQSMVLDDRPYTIVGVMPADFVFERPAYQIWSPLPRDPPREELSHGFEVLALVKPRIPIQRAGLEVQTITAKMPGLTKNEEGWHATLVPYLEHHTKSYRRALLVLWAAVGLVLLIACANAGNLLLARASRHRREFAVRVSLGARPARLARQIVLEGLVAAGVAAALGAGLAQVLLKALVAWFGTKLPVAGMEGATVDGAALSVAAALAVLTALLSAVPSCVDLLRVNVGETLAAGTRGSAGSRGAGRMRSVLVAGEVGLSLVLLFSAGLLLRSLTRILDNQLGFRPEHVLTARVSVPPSIKKAPERAAYYDRMLAEVRTVPGVRSAAVTTVLPLGGLVASTSFSAEGTTRPPDEWRRRDYAVFFRSVTPGYFRTMGMTLRGGRFFTDADNLTGAREVIINEDLAQHFWPGQSAVGKRISRDWPPDKDTNWLTVVGVVADTRHRGLKEKAEGELYLPLAVDATGAQFSTLVLRVEGEPRSIAGTLERRIHQMNPSQPVSEVTPMERLVLESVSQPRFQALLLEIFAALALTLAATGTFAVISYTVTQRTREIGIRGALGATPGRIVALVVSLGLRPVLAGGVLGLLGALAAARLLRSELYETRPSDPVALSAAVAVLLAAALVALLGPAWRAARINPGETLRAE